MLAMSQPNDPLDHNHDPDDTRVTNKLHPLLLPEVLRLIGPHLSQAGNVACLRVCRTWQLNLTPFLFREVLLPKRSSGKPKAAGKTSKRALRPLVSALQRNGYMIRALYCEDNTLLRQISSYCVHLETLVLGKVTSEVLPILRLNQGTLVRLELTPEKNRLSVRQSRIMREDQDDEDDDNTMFSSSSSSSASSSATSSPFFSTLPPLIPPPVPTLDLWLNSTTHPTGTNPKPDVPVKELIQAIMRLNRLEHLVLDHLGLSTKNDLFLPFFEFCRDHLKTLELHNNSVLDAPPHDLVFPKLHALALVNCSMPLSNQFRMIAMQTPQLKHLTWIREQFLIPLQVWADYRTYHANPIISSGGLNPGSFLSSLDISHSAVKDSVIAHCLDAHLQLERLVARDCSYIGSKSVDAIRRFKNLQVLDLRDCDSIIPGTAFYLLQGCPALRSLSLDRASAREFLEWLPEAETATWSSTQTLEELRVVFVGPRESWPSSSSSLTSFEVQQTIYRHLSKFTRLRLLNLGRSGAVKWSAKSVLDLSLANGLDQLARLTELREFDFCQMNHRLGMEEVQWMLAHWPRLERLAGYLSHDRDRAGFVESFIRYERPGIVLKHKLKYKKGLCKPKLWNREL
ncbi:MAG: hypothetical protein BYD32DRAFT_430367 [Podila humilis]|nr:MAG: hypothetical protein BYD32DRAFT_430367 [Podila humilis]